MYTYININKIKVLMTIVFQQHSQNFDFFGGEEGVVFLLAYHHLSVITFLSSTNVSILNCKYLFDRKVNQVLESQK